MKAAIKEINVRADIHETQYSKIDPKLLIGIDCFSLDSVLAMDPEWYCIQYDSSTFYDFFLV